MSLPRLYTYFRSGAAQRVRIGLALKGVDYESIPVHLVRNGGEHLLPAFKAINPQARVPVVELSDGTALAQSSAILEYLEETIPEPPLLPAAPIERAKVRRVSAIIGCDIHPPQQCWSPQRITPVWLVRCSGRCLDQQMDHART